jgi:predicted secreted protein
LSRILVTVIAGICFTISTASAGQLEQNINYLARMADGKLHRAAEISGNIYGLLKRCPALRPSEFGKAMMAVPLLLNEGLDKHLAHPAKFERAVRVFNGAYRKAVRSKVSCKAGKAKDPDSYR